MSKTFVLTGASGKLDGLLFVVDAETPFAALDRIATSMERIYEIEGLGTFLVPKTVTKEQIEAQMAEDGIVRLGWQIWTVELVKDINLHEAVCW